MNTFLKMYQSIATSLIKDSKLSHSISLSTVMPWPISKVSSSTYAGNICRPFIFLALIEFNWNCLMYVGKKNIYIYIKQKKIKFPMYLHY